MQIQNHLAIVSVPIQKWTAVYGQEQALKTGTIFPELDKPFFAAHKSASSGNLSLKEQSFVVKSPQPAQNISSLLDAVHLSYKNGETFAHNVCDAEKQKMREALLTQIQEVSFVLDDIRLYLDTHPEDENGLSLFKSYLAKRRELVSEFSKAFYPLTMDCMAGLYENNPQSSCYCWQKGPMPWEGACV